MFVPEAMASGAPVIASNAVGAALDLINHGRNGWIVPANSVDAVADALVEAATMAPERLAEMSRNARAAASQVDLPAGVERFLRAAEQTIAEFGCKGVK